MGSLIRGYRKGKDHLCRAADKGHHNLVLHRRKTCEAVKDNDTAPQAFRPGYGSGQQIQRLFRGDIGILFRTAEFSIEFSDIPEPGLQGILTVLTCIVSKFSDLLLSDPILHELG
jgi:hypothetical protein